MSGHPTRLLEGGLVAMERQGRHRYVRLASPAVAEAREGLMALAPPAATTAATRRPRGPRDATMRLARTCYDHMAGRLAVAIAHALERDGRLRLEGGAGLVTPSGEAVFRAFGIDLAGPVASRRPPRRRAARALARTRLARSAAESRTLTITPAGERGFVDVFRCEPVWRADEAEGSAKWPH